MAKLRMTLACQPYAWTKPVMDGSVQVEGIESPLKFLDPQSLSSGCSRATNSTSPRWGCGLHRYARGGSGRLCGHPDLPGPHVPAGIDFRQCCRLHPQSERPDR